jgi:tripartite-type tricarboxylate transporter receptor subunit TctC
VWNQSVIVENKPGAGGTLGIGAVVNAPPDGYTLLAQSATYVINPAVYKNLPYDVTKSLIEIDMVATSPYLLVVAGSSKIQTIDDLIGEAKAQPGVITFSSAGVGSSTHLASEYFNQITGIKTLHIPFKSTPEAMQDVISGRVTFLMAPIEAAMPQVQSGKLRALGISSKSKLDALPQVPTIAEKLNTNFEMNFWVGLWAPMNTPSNIMMKIKEDVAKTLNDPETKIAFQNAGITIKSMGQANFTKFVRDEIAKYQMIAKAAGINPQ